ncbi:MAG: exodeoxyribonuclease VII large subunit [Clostridia bacterium]|jgi:exodeoxyribonuclease VII large subunit|nr:exodeoxyribonuclease VII large subunit [Clostridia bacterium]
MYSVSPTVFSVTELNNYVKRILDNDENLKNVFVTGEISNFKNHYSGHMYMTIKDEGGAIKAVMFSSYASRLKFVPENGMKVIIFGSVSLYNKDGSYQLYITDMQPDGVGALNLAYEQLKEKLQNEGLFSTEHKKPIPQFPEKIGVMTAPDGAAVRDIFSVLKRRYPVAEIVFCPVAVQGASAAPEIAKAIKLFNEQNAADVLIVGRGGGSLEDLWAFNEEIVARAIFQSQIPVISAVGHETDFTIADFVADLRAPTPSAAAELAVPDIFELKSDLLGLKQHLSVLMRNLVESEKEKVENIQKQVTILSPANKIKNSRQELSNLYEKAVNLVTLKINDEKTKISLLSSKLNALSPLNVLSRGYSISYNNDLPIKSVNDVKSGDNIKIRVTDGEFFAEVKGS